MAADRTKTTLMIALIISVMIGFVLAVTTYLGFQQKAAEQRTSEAARSEMEQANRDRTAALDEAQRLREVLGTDKDTADAVEAERNELFDRKFAGFDKDPRSLLRLVEWLNAGIGARDEDIKRLEADKVQLRKELEAAIAQAKSMQEAAEKAREAAVAEQAKLKADFDQRWTQHEQALRDARTKQDESLAKTTQLEAITAEIEKFGPLLPPNLQRQFSGAPDGQPPPWPNRLGMVKAHLLACQKAVKELNATLAQLRVADTKLQELVRTSTPADDRIDGFDGRITAINSLDRTVLVLCDSTGGMRPGLLLWVYDPDDPRPRVGARKALVEVVEVEGPTLARARIREDSTTRPILAGDGVATSLWAPNAPQEVAIVGFIRFGADRRQDAAALKTLIERNGGRVVDGVTPTTGLVVDGGLPPTAELQGKPGSVWKPADKTIRDNALKNAKELGIRVVSLNGLLDSLGLDRETLDGRRLPNELGAAP